MRLSELMLSTQQDTSAIEGLGIEGQNCQLQSCLFRF